MRKLNEQLQTGDIFVESYDKFQKSKLYERLDKKFTVKPYYEKYSGARKLSFIASYAFNVLSAITASSAVYIGFSYHGSKKMIFELADPPLMVDEISYTENYRREIAQIDEQIESARGTTYKGTTTRTSQATIDKLTTQRKQLMDRIFEVENDIRQENKTARQGYITDTQDQAYVFALFTLLFELLFLFCLGYLEYYDFRSIGEFTLVPDFSKPGLLSQEEEKKLLDRIKVFIGTEMQQGFAREREKLQLQNTGAELQGFKEELQSRVLQLGQMQSRLQRSELAIQKLYTVLQNQLPALQKSQGEPVHKNGQLQKGKLATEKKAVIAVEKKENRAASKGNIDVKGNGDIGKKELPETKTGNGTQTTDLQQAIKKVKAKITNATYRIRNGVGKKETNERNLQLANEELEKLTGQLKTQEDPKR